MVCCSTATTTAPWSCLAAEQVLPLRFALMSTTDPTVGLAGMPVRNLGESAEVAPLGGRRDPLKADCRSTRSRCRNVHSKESDCLACLDRRPIDFAGWSDASWPGRIVDVFVAETSMGIVLAATLVLLKGISTYSEADAPPPRQSDAFSAVVNG